jgi:DNA polymerase-3 subunit gamma/tau
VLDTLVERNANRLLSSINELAKHGADFGQALKALLSILHQVSVAQAAPDYTEHTPRVMSLSQTLSKEDAQLFYQIALLGYRDLKLAPTPQVGFEMTLLRMLSFQPAAHADQASLEKTMATPSKKKETLTWSNRLSQMNLKGTTLALASSCTLKSITDSKVTLAMASSHQPLLQDKPKQRLADALSEHLGQPIKLDIQISDEKIDSPFAQQAVEKQQERNATEADTNIQKIMKTFGATLTDSE